MAFTGNGQKFTGDDGYLKTCAFGALVEGDGATVLPVGYYLVTQVDGTTGFPSPAGAGDEISAGDVLVVKTGDTITPVTNDDVVTLTMTNQCDVSSWAMEFSKEEIDVSTLCDAVILMAALFRNK